MNILTHLQTWLWGRGESLKWTRHFLQVIYRVIEKYIEDNFKERAQALTYTTLLSLVPLIAISFSVLKGFGVHHTLEPFMITGLNFLGEESAEQFVSTLIGFVENTRGVVLGGIGLAVLLYTVINLITTIENAFNRIWRVTKGRSFRERVINYLVIVLVGPIFAFIGVSVFSSSIFLKMTGFVSNPFLTFFLSKAFTIILLTLIIAMAYIFITHRRVNVIPALIGAAVASNAWYLVGKLFTHFVVMSGKQSQIYSGFASVVLFIMWMYLSWLIILIGNQIAYYLQYPESLYEDDHLAEKPTTVTLTLTLQAKDNDHREWMVDELKTVQEAAEGSAIDNSSVERSEAE